MLQAPTGFGKTLTATHIIHSALEKGHEVVFTVPALSLIDQTLAAFEAEGLDCIGVMQGDHPRTDPTQPLQIASVQTLGRRAKPPAGLVLIDEAHLAFQSIHEWMAEASSVRFIGLSATPWTRGLGRYYDDLIVAARNGDLIEAGFLSKFTVFAPSTPDLSEVGTVAGDYHEGQLAAAVDKSELVGDVIKTWLERGEDRPTFCYGVNRAHAQHLAQRFAEAGVSAEYIDAFTERADRERIFDRFRASATRIICNVGTLTVGIDLDVRCLIDARPTKSEMRFVQTIGRGLRTARGKDRLIILDHAGNHLRLGLVTDIHHDSLDDGSPRRGGQDRVERAKPLPRLCEECKAVLPRRLTVCPSCGAFREAKSEVIHTDGELVSLGSRAPASAGPTIAEMAAFYAELSGYARQRGYAVGWASHKFREKFGVWPNDPRIKYAAPTLPSLKVKQWIRSRQIAFAKVRAAYG